jgi:hypothetical protein
MNTASPYQNMFTDTKCLSFDEIIAYNAGSAPEHEKHRVEVHLLNCELCASALSGFASVPVASQDIDDLYRKIDSLSETKRWYTNSYFIASVAILLFSGTFIIVSDPFNKEKKEDPRAMAAQSTPAPDDNEQFEKPAAPAIDEPTLKKVESIRVAGKENFIKPQVDKGPEPPPAPAGNSSQEKEPPPKVTKNDPKPAPADIIDEEPAEIKYNAHVRYIEDLKVTDFEKLYTKPIDLRPTPGSTPPWQENDKIENDLDPMAEADRSIPADEVLKKGLRSFKRGKWAEAIPKFDLLLENNSKDVNALFYKGICAWNLNRSLIAQNCLMKVLASENNVFHQEAKWYLALAYIKAGETDTASELLNEIINEKGFYRKQAKEALKELR